MGRILILANKDVGLYKFRKELIQELLDQGNEVFISLPNGKYIEPLIDMGCIFIHTSVDRRGINPFTDIKLLAHYFKIFASIKPEMVITYTIKPNIYGGIVSRVSKVQYALNITGLGTAFQKKGLFKKIIISLYKNSCKAANIVFFENEENQRIFIENKIVNEKNTYKLNGAGVNLEEFRFCDFPEENGEIRFLFIGRVMKEKGIDELIDVAKRIKTEYHNVYFDIVGPLEENYSRIIKELESQNIIKYYGYQSDVKTFIKSTHCFVLPSYHEGMANTLLESGAMGRPVITSDIHGCKEAVINGESGFLFTTKDSNDLYLKIKQFLELSYEEKKKMGKVSRNHIADKFDKQLVVNETLNKIKH